MRKSQRFFRKGGAFLYISIFLLMSFLAVSCRDYSGSPKESVVRVKLTEYDMELQHDDPIKPGVTVFEVTNEGRTEHSFVIEGIDVLQRLEEDLKPGETRSISVELKPSGYNVYCPVDDHKNKGMASVIRIPEQNDREQKDKEMSSVN